MRVAVRVLALAAVLLTVAAADAAPHRGRPTVKLDHLEFPAEVPGARFFVKRLERLLAHHARRADWGAGRGSVIEYRFAVKELSVVADGDVLRVTCEASGKLPSGRGAKSRISYGGAPGKRNELVLKVLEIVSRGVVTRLAELERIRRGELDHRRVRAPHDAD